MRFAVNATALRASGALTILKQFINRASQTKHEYVIFISNDVKLEQKNNNITFIEVAPKNWLERIFWDFYAFNKEILSLGVSIDKVISLQNTTVNVNLPQIIYLHQSIPFSDIKFSIKSYCEFKLFLYKKFYMFFIFAFLKDDTKFFVQTNWMKNALCAKSRINEKRVFIVKPDILLPKIDCKSLVSDSNKIKYIYPATYLPYKNHLIILKALVILSKNTDLSDKEICVQVTLSEFEFSKFYKIAEKYGVSDYIENLGVLKYNDLIDKYQQSDGLIFPSFIETYGLPLAEAATLGKRVLCSDLPYSRDVLCGYEGATYIIYDDALKWAESMKSETVSQRFEWKFPVRPTWDDFFNNL